ncbi:MAG TPA: OmpA family protein, partial [Gammaproteobacteria bacterium]|nr:OmpA family protein [Gammaproteobacteria bacterium]
PQPIDIPLDPATSSLFLDKRTGLDVAAIGDFVPYTVTVRNATAGAPMTNVVVTDSLPPGMRYQAGSARLDATVPLEPEISADGSTLTFRLPDLAAQRSATLRYVAVVVTGAVGGTLVNHAIARADDGSESNAASAAVLLREELFTSSSLLLGRIRAGTCGASGDGTDGVAGVRVYLEDGRYAVTDDEGKYHFEGLTPGSHVVQLDPITLPAELEPLTCDNRVRSAGNALSQFVDMRGGALGTADFVVGHRAAPTGDVRFSLTTQLANDGFEHAATIAARDVPLTEAEVVVLLPDTFAYVPGSAARDGVELPDPAQASGSLRFTLGPVEADRPERLTFATRAPGGPAGDHSVQALLRFTTALGRAERTEPVANVVHGVDAVVERVSYTFSPRSNAYSFAPQFGSGQTQLDPRDGAELDRIAAEWRGMRELTIHVIGHSDRTPIAVRNRDRFPDNYALSRARAQAVANYLQGALPDSRIEVEGRGADEPVSDGTDAASLALNRRVEIEVEGVRAVSAADWNVVTSNVDAPTLTTTGTFRGADDAPRRPLASAHPPGLEALEPEIDVATVEPGIAILQPSEGFAPPVPTVHITIAHLPGQEVQLTVNGHAVNELAFDGTKVNAAKTASLSRWRGVDLAEGDNRIVATVSDGDGREIAVVERSVRYGGGAVRAELVAEESQLTADGRTQPLIALRVFDASGQPARPGTLGAFRVDPPYRTWWEVETLHDNPLLVESSREPTFAVEEDGLVRILLEPTTESGTALIRLRFNERQEQEIRAWLEPEQRDWILVGIAETTTAYTNLEAAMEPPDVEDGYTGDGRLAFFAKGRIKGSTLLTIAFDSDRDRRQVEDRLFGTIEPDRYYTLYGDAVEQRFEAATTRKLYLKIERRQFAALFGDFETGLTVTELSRYSRSLTGLKDDFGGERFAVNAFAAENRERYGRDEFIGDGTSGPYRLSRTPLVANSDRLRIEVRDRVRTEVVIESRPLTRFIDYSLDYYTGTLTFKQPVSSRDSQFNPVFIVAEYETLLVEAGGTTAGARASARLSDTVELGATLVDEGSAIGASRLAGTDLTFRPTGALEVRAEVAQTASDYLPRASAYLAEIEHVTERLDLNAYVREQELGFGVGQQLHTETGTRKVGIDARTALTELWTARGETFRQTNLSTGADRELASAEARRETDDATASVGVKRVIDDLPQSGEQQSELLSLGGSLDVLHDRVTLRALTEQAIGDPAASLDFPERTALGLDYHLTGATTLFAEVE